MIFYRYFRNNLYFSYCSVLDRLLSILNHIITSVYPAKGRPGSGATKLDWGAQIMWDGPASNATGHATRPAHDWPVLKSASVRTDSQAIEQSSDHGPCGLSQNRPFCTIFLIFTHKGSKFSGCFHPFTSNYDPYEIGTHVIEKTGRHTHTHDSRFYFGFRVSVLK